MKKLAISAAFAAILLAASGTQEAQAQQAAASQTPTVSPLVLNFAGKRYLHRGTNKSEHTFFPAGERNLQRWREMLSLESEPTFDTA